MGRGLTGATAGVVGSAIVLVLGIVIVQKAAGTDLAVFGWLLAVVGALSVAANLVIRARTR